MSGSTVQITYDDAGTPVDITNDVLFEDAQFESQMNAVAGTFSFRVKDPDQSYDFVTGREIRLYIDGIPMFGGYVKRVGMTYPFPADNTSNPEAYEKRIWRLEGVDYNVLFDTLFIRKTTNYLGHAPNETGWAKTTMDGYVLRTLLSTYCDFPSGFDATSEIDDITAVLPDDSDETFFYKQQGTKIRDQFDEQAAWAGAVFYIGPDKKVHYHAYETIQKRWGFSDSPNYNAITTSPDEYQGATWGFREVSGTEDGTLIINDALIWGGGAPATTSTVFARIQDDTDSYTYVAGKSWIDDGDLVPGSSIDTHGRWQISETHFNELKILSAVKARANVIVNGPPGADVYGQQKGLRYPQWFFEFTWFGEQVPELDGTPDHIIAGDIVSINLASFDVSEYMPCRTLRITFPELDPGGNAHVQFNGEFSLQYTDPIALWKTILNYRPATEAQAINAITDDSTDAGYGDYATLTPLESMDGSRTVFTVKFAYIMNTLVVYLNGLQQVRDTHYTESDPASGEFTMTSAPVATDTMYVTCRTLGT
jgi:hypothetical protein